MTLYAASRMTARTLRASFGLRPFTRHEAEESGVSVDQLRYAVAGGLVQRLHRGWYAVLDEALDALASARGTHPPHAGVPAAALAVFRDLQARRAEPVMAGSLASRWWDLDTWDGRPGDAPSPGVVLVAPGCGVRRGQRHGLIIREAELDERDIVTTQDGLAFTGVLRTGVDCARGRDPIGAFIVCNSAARRSLDPRLPWHVGSGPASRRLTDLACDPSLAATALREMGSALERCSGHGLSAVKRVIDRIDVRLETALEALSWWRFGEHGIVLPEPQQWVRGASGRLYRVDFDFDGVIGEADGLGKYGQACDLHVEKRRQIDIELAGKPVVRWGWLQMWHHPGLVMAALDNARR